MTKLRDYLGVIIALAAVIGIVMGGLNYFATAKDLELVQLRLDQKIVNDQLFDAQRQVWVLEERNAAYGSDCSRWPDKRDREQYRQLKVRLDELQKRQDHLLKK